MKKRKLYEGSVSRTLGRHYCLLYLIAFGCLLMGVEPSFAQKGKPSKDVIVERLNSLERENQRVREDISELKAENKDLKSKDKEIDEDLKEYEPFKFWGWILAGLGIGNIIGIAWLYLKVIPSKVNKQVDAIIAKHLTDRHEAFIGLLKDYDFENTVKQRYQIVLLSHRNGSDDYHHRMLSKNGFQVKAYTRLEQLQEAEFTPDDILVINNDGDHWPVDQIQTFINTLPNYCFYFGNGRIAVEGERLSRFTAANFRTQFIGNLMNVLKYSHHQN